MTDEVTFNPDPAQQASAMIEMFLDHARTDPEYESVHRDNARAIALISSRMLRNSATRSINDWSEAYRHKIPPGVTTDYWDLVIAELESVDEVPERDHTGQIIT